MPHKPALPGTKCGVTLQRLKYLLTRSPIPIHRRALFKDLARLKHVTNDDRGFKKVADQLSHLALYGLVHSVGDGNWTLGPKES